MTQSNSIQVHVSFAILNMAKIHEVLSIYEKLKNEWNRKPPNVEKTMELLRLLKVYISNFIFFSFYFLLIQNHFAEGGFYPSDSNEDTRGLHLARMHSIFSMVYTSFQ